MAVVLVNLWRNLRRLTTACLLCVRVGLFGFRHHTHLDVTQIRLIRVASLTAKRQTSRFTIETFSLDGAPPYIALSYTWGPPLDSLSL